MNNERCYFSLLLKLIFCSLFLIINPGLAIGTNIVEEPNSITSISDKEYCVEYDCNEGMYFGIECLTPETKGWWERKIAYEAYLQFSPLQETRSNYKEMLESTKGTSAYDRVEAMISPSLEEREGEEIFSSFLSEIKSNTSFMDLVERSKQEILAEPLLACPDALNKQFSGVLRSLKYNLDHYTEGGKRSTWVAYVSSKPITGPISKQKDFAPDSPDVKAIMIVKFSERFCVVEGMFNSLVVSAYDKKNSTWTKNLSAFLLSHVYSVISKIKPTVTCIILRPYEGASCFEEELKLSGLSLSVSRDGRPQGNKPCILFEGGEHGFYWTGPVNDFALSIPSIDTICKINDKHWFCISPFLAARRDELARESYDACPFIIIYHVPTAEEQAGITVVEEPSSIIISTSSNYCVEKNTARKLYFGMQQLLTPQAVDWWKKRLAYEAYMHFEREFRYCQMEDIREELSRAEEVAHSLYEPYRSEIEHNQDFMALFASNFQADRLSCEANRLRARREYNRSLANAFEGFDYHLQHYTEGGEGVTWVAYVSSRPINGPLSEEKDLNIASSDIKMAVTIKISETFYTPLGIYRSPIAQANDKHATETKNLSMSLHSYIARTMPHIRGSVKYVVVRPLPSMLRIFESSGLCYAKTATGQEQTNLPHISFAIDQRFGDMTRDFTLVEPSSKTIHKFSRKHWFSTNPFLAGNYEKNYYLQYPFLTIQRIDLVGLP